MILNINKDINAILKITTKEINSFLRRSLENCLISIMNPNSPMIKIN